MAKISTIEELLGLPDAEQVAEIVTIAGLGTVRVRAISLREHREIRRDCVQGDQFDTDRFETLLLTRCVAEPALTYDQAAQLCAKAVGPVDDLVGVCFRVSGLTKRGEISKEAVDDAEATFQPESDPV